MAVMELENRRDKNDSNNVTREEIVTTPSLAFSDQLQDFHSLHEAIKELYFSDQLIFT